MQTRENIFNIMAGNKLRIIMLCMVSILLLPLNAAGIWVSLDGNDENPGSETKPKATLNSALRLAREMRRLNDPAISGGITINMEAGEYQLFEPVMLRPEDSGTKESPTIIRSVNGGKVILSGGMQVKNWKKATGNIKGLPIKSRGQIWEAEAPAYGGRTLDYRQLWINGRKAVRARDVNDDNLQRITSWDKKSGKLGVPSSWIDKFAKDGRFTDKSTLEVTLHQMWAIANLRVKDIEKAGKEYLISFQQPEARIQVEHPWPTPMTVDSVRSPFYLSNAIEFLDERGEWFLDKKNKKLYYWPLKDENPKKDIFVIPYLETLVSFKGTLDSPVSNIMFDGITFAYTTWLRPSNYGHVPLQAGMYLLDAYKLKPPGVPGNQNKGLENQAWIGRPPAAVELNCVQNTGFMNCIFEHLGSCGLDYEFGTNNDVVKGCIFRDIAGNGIQAGKFSDEGVETHLPYDPSDKREICTNLTISNNLITDVSNQDWGCTGIAAGYVRGINIEHNEICDISYTGISLGWGWTKTVNCMRDNRVLANYIHHYAKHMYDVAGIYTLSVQPKTVIAGNVVENIYKPEYVHDPNHWFYLYTDEGSSFITVRDNWCPQKKFLQNANGPGNTWENNGPEVSEKIKNNAGLQSEYKNLKNK